MGRAPPVITDPHVERYILELGEHGGNRGLPGPIPQIGLEIEDAARKQAFPIAGPLVGRSVCMFAGMIGARRILDAGAGFGYSGLWLAAGAGRGARITCVDRSSEALMRARDFHKRAGLGDLFEYVVGDALDVLDGDPGPFDIVFNDVDKERYPKMAKLAVPRLRPGGLYLAGNVLWYGKVCVYGTTWDAWTTAVHQHNDWLFNQPDLFCTIYDQSDGLLAAVRRA
jgi:predicted O-methyltransferase YrrM